MNNKALTKNKGTSRKRAIVPRGKYEKQFEPMRYDDEIKIRDLADQVFDEYQSNPAIIWLQDLFIKRFVSRKQIANMNSKSEYFGYIYSLLKDIQESRLFHAGIGATGNVNQVIFALKNICKWRSEPKEEPQQETRHEIVLDPENFAETDYDNDNEH